MSDDAPTALVVLCTVPSAEVGTTLGKALVERRLAACVNLLGPIRSFYRWEGAVHDDPEHQLVIKTTRDRFDDLRDAIGELHPYDVPEILALPVVAGSPSYLEWLSQQVR